MIAKLVSLRILPLLALSFAVPVCGQSALAQQPLPLEQLATTSRAVTLQGIVFTPTGAPAVGAVVVSSAGGKAVTSEDGKYRLAVRVPLGAESVQVTAVGGAGGKLMVSKQVPVARGQAPNASMQLAQTSGCTPGWLPTFGGHPGVNIRVTSVAVFNDGSGPALYVGGWFEFAGGVKVNSIARWDGSTWTALGSGVEGPQGGVANAIRVNSLLVFDDGSGDALYVGGNFTTAGGIAASKIAKWDGSTWSALGIGLDQQVVSLAVFNDGSGDALHAGGSFWFSGGTALNGVAKWDGSSWSGLGAGMTGSSGSTGVVVLHVFDDGGGDELYVGGVLTSAGGVPVEGITKWNGSSWAPLGSGVGGLVGALTVFDDGSGDALYVGGTFSSAGGFGARNIAKWNGLNWSSLGFGLSMPGTVNDGVGALTVFDDGSGARLIAAYAFSLMNSSNGGELSSWDGSSWSAVSSTSGAVWDLTVFDSGAGDALIAGGTFVRADGMAVNAIAEWDGSSWSAFGSGLDTGVTAFAEFDDGSGSALFAGGAFISAGGVTANRIAKWDGSTWSPLGNGLEQRVFGLTVFDDGTGESLYAGLAFETFGGVVEDGIAKWDGSAWSSLGLGIGGAALNGGGVVTTFVTFDDGGGPVLIVGGSFTLAGGLVVENVAQWDGTTWSALGAGLHGGVFELEVFDDGSGPAIFAAGFFTAANGVTTHRLAKWDGTAWSPVGSGFSGGVSTLAVFDDGSGPVLVVGGGFTSAGGVPANRVAKWDGSTFTPLGNGIGDFEVSVLSVLDDGTGPALFASGRFTIAGGGAANGIAKWDGSVWTPLGAGISGGASALIEFDDGGGPALFAGGWFPSVEESGDSYIAKWGCEREPFGDFCNGDGGDQLGCTNCPCANNATPGTIGGCLNSALTSVRLVASGNASVSLPSGDSNDLRFSINSAPANAVCILNSGDALAPTGMANPCFGMNSGVQASLFDGLRCAVTNTRRHGGRSADSNGDVGVTNSPWGGEGGPPVGIAQQGAGFVAGQTRYFQVINRDDPLAQCMRGLNTSQAVEVVFEP